LLRRIASASGWCSWLSRPIHANVSRPLFITTVRHRRWEPLGDEVLKQKRDGRRVIADGSPDGVSDAPDFTSVSHSSCERSSGICVSVDRSSLLAE
jgi:hypothetical protein